jgi:hypothetical protein
MPGGLERYAVILTGNSTAVEACMEKKVTSSGAKAYQRNDAEWRIQPYSDWHRTLPSRLLMVDVDFIEWRYRKGELVPVGVMEVTRVDRGRAVDARYLDVIVRRFEQRDLQAVAARKVAEALKTKAYITLFRQDCSEFWVYNLTDRSDWMHHTPQQMSEFLQKL